MSREFRKKLGKNERPPNVMRPVAPHTQSPRCAVCSFVLNLLSQVGILSISPALLKRTAAFNGGRSYCISVRMSNPLCLAVGSKRFWNITSTAGVLRPYASTGLPNAQTCKTAHFPAVYRSLKPFRPRHVAAIP